MCNANLSNISSGTCIKEKVYRGESISKEENWITAAGKYQII